MPTSVGMTGWAVDLKRFLVEKMKRLLAKNTWHSFACHIAEFGEKAKQFGAGQVAAAGFSP
jgi:hypothetical protein